MLKPDQSITYTAPCPGCGEPASWLVERWQVNRYIITCDNCSCPTRRSISREGRP